MAKSTTKFVCRSCGAMQPRWMGKCPDCGTWDALEEVRAPSKAATQDPHRSLGNAAASEAAPGGGAGVNPSARPISELTDADNAARFRTSTGIHELDRVLGGSGPTGAGGGLVPGSATLLGGDPGIGKSTLMLQATLAMARAGHTVLYVTSEESAAQLRLRAERLATSGGASGGGGEPRVSTRRLSGSTAPHFDDEDENENENDGSVSLPDTLYVLADTNLARIAEQARRLNPALVVIDSIQMIYKGDLAAAPGSVTQLRACCLELVYQAKASGWALILVGHVTKQGALAGPRLLEHMVDAVLYFEGDRYHSHRVVRGIKNRFGNTLEVGLFQMTDRGLEEVADGAGLLAAEYQPAPGSAVVPALHGSRCLLVEVQALTATGFLGSAKRKVSGLDRSRLDMLIAVLEKRGGLRLADQDIFASSVGGLKVGEPAADLGVALAIAGAHLDRSLDAGTCALGEIGLGGEIRPVQHMDRRLIEAGRLGFTKVLCPAVKLRVPKGVELIAVKRLDGALQVLS